MICWTIRRYRAAPAHFELSAQPSGARPRDVVPALVRGINPNPHDRPRCLGVCYRRAPPPRAGQLPGYGAPM